MCLNQSLITNILKIVKDIYKRLIVILVCLAGIALFLFLTNPQSLNVGYLLVPFILVAILLYQLFLSVMLAFRIGGSHLSKQKLVAMLLSILVTNFLILQSIGRLMPQDVILIGGISLIIGLYLSKFQLPSK